jgi:hypothetical protein
VGGSSSSGDIVLLSPGTIIPADGRLLTGHVSSLEVDEALLTGESLPVAKISEAFSEADIPLGDRLNMVYGGSQVTKGRGKAVVVATGMDTELGKIAEAMERQVKTKETGWRKRWYRFKVALGVAGTSPLQIKLNRLAYLLLSIAILLAIIVLASTAFVDIPESISTVRVLGALGVWGLGTDSIRRSIDSMPSPPPSPSCLLPSSQSYPSLSPPQVENWLNDTLSFVVWMREGVRRLSSKKQRGTDTISTTASKASP